MSTKTSPSNHHRFKRLWKASLLTTTAVAFIGTDVTADTITVCLDGTCDHTDIQSAIDVAVNGDLISISGETYLLDATLDTLGKRLTLRGAGDEKTGASNTILDGQGLHRVLQCINGEGPESIFEHLVIQSGTAIQGGGMYCEDTAPTIRMCVFRGNSAERGGGGLYTTSSEDGPLVSGCLFEQNTTSSLYWISSGGGLYASRATVTQCIFTENRSDGPGSAAAVSFSIVTDSVFCGNPGQQFDAVQTTTSGNCLRNQCLDTGAPFSKNCRDLPQDRTLYVPQEYATIGAALDAAAPGAIIHIEAGIHLLEREYETLGKSVTLQGAIGENGAPATILDAQSNSRHLSVWPNQKYKCTLRNLAFVGGQAEFGGALLLSAGSDRSEVLIENCRFEDNVGMYGGAIFAVSYEKERLVIRDTTFHSNRTTTFSDIPVEIITYGAAICLLDQSGLNGKGATITGCHFESNQAAPVGGNGGAIKCWFDIEISLMDCTFVENSAGMQGGAIYIDDPYDEGRINTIERCRFTGNHAGSDLGGGAIHVTGPTPLSVQSSSFCDNSLEQITGPYIDRGLNCFADTCEALEDSAEPGGAALAVVLGNWGCTGQACNGDFNGDEVVNGADLTVVLNAWGTCQ